MTNPNAPIGQNRMSERTRELARLCSFDDADFCTNHGNRALGITTLVNAPNAQGNKKPILKHSRHNGEKSQTPYNRDTALSEHMLQNSLHSSLSKPQPQKPTAIESSAQDCGGKYLQDSTAIESSARDCGGTLMLPPSTTATSTAIESSARDCSGNHPQELPSSIIATEEKGKSTPEL